MPSWADRVRAVSAQRARPFSDITGAPFLPGLVREFAQGGITVESKLIRTVVQADGDVQMMLGCEFRSLPLQEQQAALEAHLAALKARLAPLAALRRLALRLRTALSMVSATLTALLVQFQEPSTGSLHLWTEVVIPRAIFAVLVFYPAPLADIL